MEGWQFRKRVFITGATGFIGSQVVEELQGGRNTLLVVCQEPPETLPLSGMPNVNIVQGDLSDIDRWKAEVRRFDPQVTVHIES